jgi:hypothetical protein
VQLACLLLHPAAAFAAAVFLGEPTASNSVAKLLTLMQQTAAAQVMCSNVPRHATTWLQTPQLPQSAAPPNQALLLTISTSALGLSAAAASHTA